jgi:sialate O-acetylesterase
VIHAIMKRIALAGLCLLLPLSAMAEVSVSNIIGDHMVLQQGKPVPVWGKAAPGESVSVTLAGQTLTTAADTNGLWRVELSKLNGGGPLEMTITGKDDVLSIKDILVGEVWLGAGQSNMWWWVKDSMNGIDEVAAANQPSIRLFQVSTAAAPSPMDNCNFAWKTCTPENISDFSAVLYFFGRNLQGELEVPVGLIGSAWGGTPAEAWTSRAALDADPDLKGIGAEWDERIANYPKAKAAYHVAMQEWQKAADQAKAAGLPEPAKPVAPEGPNSHRQASGAYNAMIAPLVPFALRGVIWYQGEANVGRAKQYQKLFPVLIMDWRTAWNQTDLPFYFVQLANFRQVRKEPFGTDGAELREAQTMALKLEKTGMAVAIDIGESYDIHPKNKQEVGRRLALIALARDYDKKVDYASPMYKSMAVTGKEAVIAFDNAEGLVAKGGGALKGFAIAGSDKKFVWADAKIEDGKVVVSSPKVGNPAAVRYAWVDDPVCNLYNGAGLPAAPFRTDAWSDATLNNP